MVTFALAPTLELGLVALAVAGFGFLAASTYDDQGASAEHRAAHRGRIMALWTVAFSARRPLQPGRRRHRGATSPRVSALVMVAAGGRPGRRAGRARPARPAANTGRGQAGHRARHAATHGGMVGRSHGQPRTARRYLDPGQPGARPLPQPLAPRHTAGSRLHPGDDVVVTTRDAVDGQLTMDSTHDDLLRTDRTLVHPLTGPISSTARSPETCSSWTSWTSDRRPSDTPPSFPASDS